MAEPRLLHGLDPEALALSVEAFFTGFPWEPPLDAAELPAGAFLESL